MDEKESSKVEVPRLPDPQTPQPATSKPAEPAAGKPAAAAAPQEGAQPDQKRPLSRWRRGVRWVLSLLILFGIGFAAALWLFFVPMRQQYAKAQSALQSAEQAIQNKETAAGQQVNDLEAQVQSLQGLATRNQELENELQDAQLHNAILRAINDVTRAQLALAQEDTSQANLALSTTSNTLESISGMLAPNQRQTITNMQSRLELAQNELETDVYAAASDLDVLLANLVALENTFFATP